MLNLIPDSYKEKILHNFFYQKRDLKSMPHNQTCLWYVNSLQSIEIIEILTQLDDHLYGSSVLNHILG